MIEACAVEPHSRVVQGPITLALLQAIQPRAGHLIPSFMSRDETDSEVVGVFARLAVSVS